MPENIDPEFELQKQLITKKIREVSKAVNNLEFSQTEEDVKLFMQKGGELVAMILKSLGIKGQVTSTTTVK